MSKDSSVNYNQDNKKERLEKKLVKDIKVFPKKKKRKKSNMVVDDTKFYQNMKKQMNIENGKKYWNWILKRILQNEKTALLL